MTFVLIASVKLIPYGLLVLVNQHPKHHLGFTHFSILTKPLLTKCIRYLLIGIEVKGGYIIKDYIQFSVKQVSPGIKYGLLNQLGVIG